MIVHSYRVAKRIAPSDMFDLNLNRNLFVIYARRIATSLSGLTRLDSHSGGGNAVRSMSAEQVNPAQTGGTVGGSEFDRVTRPRLIRAHGTLMIIAWPMLAVMGIFFTVFMRPAMPDGGWFQVSRLVYVILLSIHLIFVNSDSSVGNVWALHVQRS